MCRQSINKIENLTNVVYFQIENMKAHIKNGKKITIYEYFG